jgi:hypothetical protein
MTVRKKLSVTILGAAAGVAVAAVAALATANVTALPSYAQASETLYPTPTDTTPTGTTPTGTTPSQTPSMTPTGTPMPTETATATPSGTGSPTVTESPTPCPCPSTTPPQHRRAKLFVVKLNGANENPPADLGGRGFAFLLVSADRTKICYLLAVSHLQGDVILAHIHQAPKGVNGPIVVPLTPPIGGSSADCATVPADLGSAIVDSPENYYVNVHTTVFPMGAIRGQLRPGTCFGWWCDKHQPTPAPTQTRTEEPTPTGTDTPCPTDTPTDQPTETPTATATEDRWRDHDQWR